VHEVISVCGPVRIHEPARARELFASTLLQLAKIGYRVGEEKGLRWHVGPV